MDGFFSGVWGGPRDFCEEFWVVAGGGEEVVAAVWGGAESDGFWFCLDEGGVDPAGGEAWAVGADDGDFLVAFLEALLCGCV